MIFTSNTLAKIIFNSPNKIELLEKLLGTDSQGNLNKIEISVNTDRNDPYITKHILDVSQRIKEVANILEVNPEEIKFQHDSEQSDHEDAVHICDLNNVLRAGSVVERKGQLYQLNHFCSIQEGWQLENLNNGERAYYSSYSFNTIPKWSELLLIR